MIVNKSTIFTFFTKGLSIAGSSISALFYKLQTIILVIMLIVALALAYFLKAEIAHSKELQKTIDQNEAINQVTVVEHNNTQVRTEVRLKYIKGDTIEKYHYIDLFPTYDPTKSDEENAIDFARTYHFEQ